jgi:hypothetical protein
MTLKSRLKKLEQGAGGGTCPECEFPAAPGEKLEVKCHYREYGVPAPAHEGPEFCPACGRPLVIELRWTDAPEAPYIPALGSVDIETEGETA